MELRQIKIVLLDSYTEKPGDLSWNEIEKLGEFVYYDHSPNDEDEIVKRIGDAEIVLTNKTPISRSVLEKCPNVKFIAVLATDYNINDCDFAAERGIPVSNVPTYDTAAVGQFAIALLLEICYHVAAHSEVVHASRWTSYSDWYFWDYPLIELDGKTIGIIAFSKMEQTTGRIAKLMGMKVLATGSRPNESGKKIAEYTDLDTLLAKLDVIALHCPLFPSTQGIINRETITKMKDGVIIINKSRGSLIVEEDLAEALNSGKVFAAGLDVVSTEPIKSDNRLLSAKNCLITPHISWALKESRQRIMNATAEDIAAFIDGKLINVVNQK